ncbi:hypothetical protein LTS18_003766, partial [Coniosporium uncinatum]
YPPVSASDRFRHTQLAASPTSAPATARSGASHGYPSYAFGEGPQFPGASMAVGTLQYQPEYAPESQRSQQPYQQYGSNMMYSAPQQQAAAPQSPYESVQQYQQPRQSAAIEVLSSHFGVPQSYYNVPGEGGPTSAPTGMGAQPSQYPPLSHTTQSPVGRDSIATAYPSGMQDPTQGNQGVYGQQGYSQQSASELDHAWAKYQAELRRTFECVRDGRLSEGGELLIKISDWLLPNAENLGMFSVNT